MNDVVKEALINKIMAVAKKEIRIKYKKSGTGLSVQNSKIGGKPAVPHDFVWPYYTGIRNFKSVSFKYPVKLDTPVFSCTTTYQKHKNKVRTILYIDGPFYPDKRLNLKQAQEKLRNEVYQKMVARSKMSNIEVIKYIKEEQKIKSKI